MNERFMIAEELAKIAEEIVTAGRPRMTKEEFVQRAKEVHGDAYDYSRVDMDNRDDKGRVYIICKKCGQGFWQRPDKHLDGNGCMNCYVQETGMEPGQPMEEDDDDGLQMNFTEPSQQPAQAPAQKPVAPAPNPPTPPTPSTPPTPQAPQPASESDFQQSQPLAQPVVRSDG